MEPSVEGSFVFFICMISTSYVEAEADRIAISVRTHRGGNLWCCSLSPQTFHLTSIPEGVCAPQHSQYDVLGMPHFTMAELCFVPRLFFLGVIPLHTSSKNLESMDQRSLFRHLHDVHRRSRHQHCFRLFDFGFASMCHMEIAYVYEKKN